MVVAPPSLHPSGKHYRWRQGHHPAALPLAVLPRWLARLAQRGTTSRGHAVAYWRSLVKEGIEEGKRNTTIASFAGHLLWHCVDAEVVLELLLCWNRLRCRPPLDDGEVRIPCSRHCLPKAAARVYTLSVLLSSGLRRPKMILTRLNGLAE